MNLNTVNKTAFILEDGEYQEIATSKLIQNGRWLPPYNERRFLRLHGYLMEVDHETYIEFRRQQRREKYLREEAELHNQFSYNAADTDEYSGEELIVDILTNVENEVVHAYMVELVSTMVGQLPSRDYELIHAIFYEQVTENEYACRIGTSQSAVCQRKRAILNRFRRKLCL